MGRGSDPNRYLLQRNGLFYYYRRVPSRVGEADPRAPLVRKSLYTDDLVQARAKRDQLEAADGALWSAMVAGDDDPASTRKLYDQAVKRAEALSFSYRTSAEIAERPLEEIVRRIQALPKTSEGPQVVEAALLGRERPPKTGLEAALDLYITEIAKKEVAGKSPNQKRRWINKHKWAVSSFIEHVGDKPIEDITCDDARAYYRYWLALVAPDDPEVTPLSASTANRAMELIRKIYSAYYGRISEFDTVNPFRNISFSENEEGKRPSFTVDWLQNKIMAPSALATTNDELRGIVLALIETGARLSELCNLLASSIVLDHPFPHINIGPSLDRRSPGRSKRHHRSDKYPSLNRTGFPGDLIS